MANRFPIEDELCKMLAVLRGEAERHDVEKATEEKSQDPKTVRGRRSKSLFPNYYLLVHMSPSRDPLLYAL